MRRLKRVWGRLGMSFEDLKIKMATIGDYVDSVSITYKFKGKDKVRFLNTSDILEGKVLNNNWSDISTLPGQAKKSIQNGDILFSEIRPANKRYAKVDFDAEDFVVSTKLMVLRPKNEIVVDYLYIFLTSQRTLNYLQVMAESRSGTFPQITFEQLKEVQILVPTITQQRKISKIISEIDRKIDLNTRLNKALEKTAQAIFKHWFIDFEFPNENGEPYKSSGGEMEMSEELGKEVPKGWKVRELGEMALLTMGLSPKSSSYNEIREGIPLLNGAADFEGVIIKPTKFTTDPKRVCDKGEMVFCIRATIGNITFTDRTYCLGRGVASIKSNKKEYIELIYYSLQKSIEELKAKATGSVILGLSKPDINKVKIILPYQRTLCLFSETSRNILDKISSNDKQIVCLKKLRDTLLPKLMSGEIDVSKVEV
jgi:type I restriction enzyme, S subunit